MRYCLDVDGFKKRLPERGYSHLNDFASRAGLHRNTLQNLLKGETVFRSSFVALSEQLAVDPLELIRPVVPLKVPVKGIEEIASLVARLTKEDEQMAVLLVGSRARGKGKIYSDWDLGVFRYPEPLTGREYLKLKNRVEEWSENLVREVDLINLNQAPLWFLEGMKPHFLAGNEKAFAYFLGVLNGIQREQAHSGSQESESSS